MEAFKIISSMPRGRSVAGGYRLNGVNTGEAIADNWIQSHSSRFGKSVFRTAHQAVNPQTGGIAVGTFIEWAPWITEMTITFSGASYASGNGSTYASFGTAQIGPLTRMSIREAVELNFPQTGTPGSWIGFLSLADWSNKSVLSVGFPNGLAAGGPAIEDQWPNVLRIRTTSAATGMTYTKDGNPIAQPLQINLPNFTDRRYNPFSICDTPADSTDITSHPANRLRGEPCIMGLPRSQWGTAPNMRNPELGTYQRTRYLFVDGAYRMPIVMTFTFA
jgi:hypothetical protein